MKKRIQKNWMAGTCAGLLALVAVPSWAGQNAGQKPQPAPTISQTPSLIGLSAAKASSWSYTPGTPVAVPAISQAIPQAISMTPAQISAAALLAANGTGVGNGGPSARDAYLQKLKAELTPPAGSSTQSDITQWCGQVSAVLIRERQRAMMQYEFEKLDDAEQILIDAMVTAAQSLNNNPNNPQPMTLKVLNRTLEYSQALDQVLPNTDRLSEVTKLNFLFSSVDFIVNVAENLDPPYYIPYQYQYGGCPYGCPSGFPFQAFERAFVQMAADQLSFVVNDLTESGYSGNPDGSTQIYPVGDPKAFLTVAALVTNDVADDLSQNLHAYENACAIGELQALSQELTAYNVNGDTSVFPNDPWAVSQAASEMSELANQISSDEPFCGSAFAGM